MFYSTDCNFKILSVLKLTLNKQVAFTDPRNFHALSYRIKGDATFKSGKNKYHAKTNDLIYVPKGQGYTLESNEKESVIVVHFDIINDQHKENNEFETFSPGNPYIFKELLEKMHDAWNKNDESSKWKVLSYFYDILANIEMQNSNSLTDLKSQLMDEICSYISSNFSNPSLNVEHIAETFKISSAYLRKIFKKHLNTKPSAYLNERRIQYASELLQLDYYSVKEVSAMSGFSDVKYFSTSFKKHTGMTPIQRRRR